MPSPQDRFDEIASRLPIGTDPASVRRRLEAVEGVLERMFVVPGINRPVGLDAIVGLIPVLGDVVTTAGAWRCGTRHIGRQVPAGANGRQCRVTP